VLQIAFVIRRRQLSPESANMVGDVKWHPQGASDDDSMQSCVTL